MKIYINIPEYQRMMRSHQMVHCSQTALPHRWKCLGRAQIEQRTPLKCLHVLSVRWTGLLRPMFSMICRCPKHIFLHREASLILCLNLQTEILKRFFFSFGCAKYNDVAHVQIDIDLSLIKRRTINWRIKGTASVFAATC
jgi:hypothetical protein